MTTLSTTKPIISCHCSLETYSLFFKSSFSTAEFRGCSCYEDKNLTGFNQRPFWNNATNYDTMRNFHEPSNTWWLLNLPGHWSRAIQLMMTAPLIASHPTPDDRSTNPFRTTIMSHPTFDDRSTDHEPSSAHPTLDDRSTYRPIDTITAPLPLNNINL